MYDIYHKQSDNTFTNMFTPLTDIHHYNTRQKKTQTFHIKLSRTNLKSRFVSTNGIKIWEKIPPEIRSEPKHVFKKKLRSIYLNKYIDQ